MSNAVAMNECQNGNGHCCEENKDHCVNGKIFQTAKQMYIHTGNLTNWSRSNSKVVKSTTEEVCPPRKRYALIHSAFICLTVVIYFV